jgi:hypothetical protein
MPKNLPADPNDIGAIRSQLDTIRCEMQRLELSDDYCFTNGKWDELFHEEMRLQKQLRQFG